MESFIKVSKRKKRMKGVPGALVTSPLGEGRGDPVGNTPRPVRADVAHGSF